MANYTAIYHLPTIALGILENQAKLSGINFLPKKPSPVQATSRFAREVIKQLEAYFSDPQFSFDLPLLILGTPFQKRVWQALQTIPAGQVLSYGQLAHRLKTAPRAIGQACAKNSIPFVIPCHRVVASTHLGGYAGGLTVKQFLLHHENAKLGKCQTGLEISWQNP